MDNENVVVDETLEDGATPEVKTYTQEEVLELLQKESDIFVVYIVKVAVSC